MKKDMKNRLIILGSALISCFQLFAQDSISVVNVEIERGKDKSSNIIHIIFENTMPEDTLFVSSKYYIDEYNRPDHILIYRCENEHSADSLKCDWGYSIGDITPNSISFNNERVMKILPKEKLILEMPLSYLYYEYEVFLDIRMFCKIKDKMFFLSKTTNKILMEKEMDKHEKYQMRKNEERAKGIENNR